MSSRYLKYTSGEPVITTNVIAAIILGLVVMLSSRFGVVWDEEMLILGGAATLAIATAFARMQVFSPRTHALEVGEAYDAGVGEGLQLARPNELSGQATPNVTIVNVPKPPDQP